jgi:glycopeptide antibiotics resistance protein
LHVTFLGPFVLFVVAIGALVVTITERSHHRTTSSRIPLGIALSCSVTAILVLTLVPTPAANERQLVPLVHIIGGLRPPTDTDELLNVVGNALLFLSLGAALSLLGFRFRTTVLIAFSLSALVEITQLFVSGRTTSVDDVLLNTLGAVLGRALLSRWAPAAEL